MKLRSFDEGDGPLAPSFPRLHEKTKQFFLNFNKKIRCRLSRISNMVSSTKSLTPSTTSTTDQKYPCPCPYPAFGFDVDVSQQLQLQPTTSLTLHPLHPNLHKRSLSTLSTKSDGPRRRLSYDAQRMGQALHFDTNWNALPAAAAVDALDRTGDNEKDRYLPQIQEDLYGGNEPELEFVNPFNCPSVRATFLSKVLAIVGLQLLIVTAWTVATVNIEPIEHFVREHVWIAVSAVAIYCSLYFAVGLMRIGRTFPANVIILLLFTTTLAYICGYVTLKYTTWAVMMSLGATATLCMTLYAITCLTNVDVTGWGIYLTTACCLMMLYALTVFTCSFILTDSKAMTVLNVTGAFLGSALVSVYLLYDLQMMMGGRSHEIDSREWLFAAMALFYDLVMIFVYLLQVIGVLANRPASPARVNQSNRPHLQRA